MHGVITTLFIILAFVAVCGIVGFVITKLAKVLGVSK